MPLTIDRVRDIGADLRRHPVNNPTVALIVNPVVGHLLRRQVNNPTGVPIAMAAVRIILHHPPTMSVSCHRLLHRRIILHTRSIRPLPKRGPDKAMKIFRACTKEDIDHHRKNPITTDPLPSMTTTWPNRKLSSE